jgi:hypothetical protein
MVKGRIITRDSNEFFSRLQKYIFINPETEEISQPFDIDDILTVGTPIDADGNELELYGMVVED